jgi:hypothetical protein
VGVSVLAIGMACAVPWWFATDGRAGAPAAAIGAEDVFTGAALGDELRAAGAGDDAWLETARAASPAFVLNEMLAPCDRVISLGENRGWYCNRIPDYHTVWDRGLLERLLAEGVAPAECVRELRTTGYSHVVVDHACGRSSRCSIRWPRPPASAPSTAFPGPTHHDHPPACLPPHHPDGHRRGDPDRRVRKRTCGHVHAGRRTGVRAGRRDRWTRA